MRTFFTYTVVMLWILFPIACEGTLFPVDARRQALIAVNATAPDSLATDGVCSLREAWRSVANGIASADCPNDGSHILQASAGTFTFAIPNPSQVVTEDTVSATGDLDITGNSTITVRGAGIGVTVLDGGDLDRLIHAKGNAWVTLEDLTLRNGCVNGGNCVTATAGSEPIGGLMYFNSAGHFRATRVAWEGGTARTGGALGLCSANNADVLIAQSDFTGSTAQQGGAVEGHVDATFTDCEFSGNSATVGVGGAIKQYDRSAQLNNCDVHDNAAAAGGGLAAVGQWNASTAGRLVLVDSQVYANSAQKGGNVYVGATGTQGQAGLYSVPCSGVGCSAELHGSSLIDGSATMLGPDCNGFVDVYESTIGNGAGCSLVLHDPPVCGDGIVNAGEQCDDGNTEDGDQCSSGCLLESCLMWGFP